MKNTIIVSLVAVLVLASYDLPGASNPKEQSAGDFQSSAFSDIPLIGGLFDSASSVFGRFASPLKSLVDPHADEEVNSEKGLPISQGTSSGGVTTKILNPSETSEEVLPEGKMLQDTIRQSSDFDLPSQRCDLGDMNCMKSAEELPRFGDFHQRKNSRETIGAVRRSARENEKPMRYEYPSDNTPSLRSRDLWNKVENWNPSFQEAHHHSMNHYYHSHRPQSHKLQGLAPKILTSVPETSPQVFDLPLYRQLVEDIASDVLQDQSLSRDEVRREIKRRVHERLY